MATIVGGIATSHTPTIGFALDAKKQNDPVWAPIFAGYQPVKDWLAAKSTEAPPERAVDVASAAANAPPSITAGPAT